MTTIIAVYGVLLSTLVAARQFLNEQVKVQITVSKNMHMVGEPGCD